MLARGQKLNTDFTLKIADRGAVREVRFGDLLTRRTLVSVHMRNNTPTCDAQTDALVAHAAEFDQAGFNVVALSRDTCGSHQKYAVAKGIDFVLASDPEDRFGHAAEAIVEKSMYGRTFHGPKRSVWALDRDGTVLGVVDDFTRENLGERLRALIKSL